VTTVTKKFGASKEGRNDDKIVEHAKNNKNCVVVTLDGKLKKRLRAQGIKFVDLEMADMAIMVDKMLRKEQ
jgi:rRNA-processing protein FCF1